MKRSLLALLIACGASCSISTPIDPAWTDREQQAVEAAVLRGFAELEEWVDAHPEDAASLGENLVECFLDASYAATDPEFRDRAIRRARQAHRIAVAPQLAREPGDIEASEWIGLLAQANYARQLATTTDDAGLRQLVRLANAAAARADALEASLELNPDAVLARPNSSNDDVYTLLLACITLVEADLLPGVAIPAQARDLPARVWRYFGSYPLVGADQYPERGNSYTFYDTAYLATHIGYFPTGYGRHQLHEEDAPWLHAFLRENFDAVLEMGELDLVAEFVDLFRQYGFDETNDEQVRRGTRHMMKLYEAAGGSFMRHRESYEWGEIEPYDLTHKSWTAMSGLRRRQPEPAGSGTYGDAFDRLVRRRL